MRYLPTRRSFLLGFPSVAITSLSATAYGAAVEPGIRLKIQEYRVTPPSWTPGLRLRIAALADLHAGEGYMNETRIREIVDAANALSPDMIVLLGDLQTGTYRRPGTIPPRRIAEVLGRLKAPLGVHAVLGNHDWWNDREALVRKTGLPRMGHELIAAGIPVHENDAVRLVKDDKPFWLAGLGSQWAFFSRNKGADDLPRTLKSISDKAPAILLAHEPDIFPQVSNRIALTLCGHTHGGQIRMFGYSPVVPSRYGNRYAYGHIVENNRNLIVSGGLGTGKYVFRFGVPPEIVLTTIGG